MYGKHTKLHYITLDDNIIRVNIFLYQLISELFLISDPKNVNNLYRKKKLFFIAIRWME